MNLSKRLFYILTFLLAILLTIVSFSGSFIASTYQRDSLSIAVQGRGQDIFDLIFIVPLLIITMLLTLKGNKSAAFIYGGTLLYILYSFFIYCFGVHFNQMFLFYCFTLGTSFYLFVFYLVNLFKENVELWFNKIPVKLIGGYLLFIALIFYPLWFKDIIPAILNDTTPATVSNYGLLVNPVHVMDISILLPSLVVTYIMLIKNKKTGFILTPVLLVFIILLSLALIAMAVMLIVNNISEDTVACGYIRSACNNKFNYVIYFFEKDKTGTD